MKAVTSIKRQSLLALASAALLALSTPTALAAEETNKEWRFRVFLDEREIGSHDFYLNAAGGKRQLRSEARFVYKLMFLKLYEYQHQNTETWNGDCLTQIESETDANGKPYRVSGEIDDTGFRVSGSEGELVLPACVMTFAYWNPDFLLQSRLLNTQNGEFIEIEVEPPEFEELEIRGSVQPTQRYVLKAGELELNLWYSLDDEWLALESRTGGRNLRYELL